MKKNLLSQTSYNSQLSDQALRCWDAGEEEWQ